jgi:hypothetical protein
MFFGDGIELDGPARGTWILLIGFSLLGPLWNGDSRAYANKNRNEEQRRVTVPSGESLEPEACLEHRLGMPVFR